MNALRGYKEWSPDFLVKAHLVKVSVYLVWAGLLFLIYKDWQMSIALFSIAWGCNSWGWGKYYPHGRSIGEKGEIFMEREFTPARFVAELIIGKWNGVKPKKWVRKWQTVAMSFRFFLTWGIATPVVFSALSGQLLHLALAPAYLLCGVMYLIPFLFGEREHTLRIAELLNGGLLGLLIYTHILINLH